MQPRKWWNKCLKSTIYVESGIVASQYRGIGLRKPLPDQGNAMLPFFDCHRTFHHTPSSLGRLGLV